MKRKTILLLFLGCCLVMVGVGFYFVVQTPTDNTTLSRDQAGQIQIEALDKRVTPPMRAEFVNNLMRGISTGNLQALEECVCWDGVEPATRRQVLANLQDVLDGSREYPVQISFVKRMDAGQMTRIACGYTRTQNLPWLTNIGFRLEGRLAPSFAGHTMPVGMKDGRLYIIVLAPRPPA